MIIKRASDDCSSLLALQELRTHPAADPATLVAVEGTISRLQGRGRVHRAISRDMDSALACSSDHAVLHDLHLVVAGRRLEIDHVVLDRAGRLWLCRDDMDDLLATETSSSAARHLASKALSTAANIQAARVERLCLIPRGQRAPSTFDPEVLSVFVDRLPWLLGRPQATMTSAEMATVARELARLHQPPSMTDWRQRWLDHFRLPAVYSLPLARKVRRLRARSPEPDPVREQLS